MPLNPTPARRSGVESPATSGDLLRSRLQITGLVQGVGFRPFAFRLAVELDLGGFVMNDSDGVVCEVEGPPDAVRRFIADLRTRLMSPGRIDEIVSRSVPAVGSTKFEILPSRFGTGSTTPPPDVAVCDECRREVLDRADRRYGHPFISCARCGPRFTVIESLPYDRARTTMSAFPMCRVCRSEFDDPQDRRHHAQTIACPACGPRLSWRGRDGSVHDQPLETARATLANGGIVAIKGVGGFHLACNALDAAVVTTLRERKRRGDKPFAIMAVSVDVAANLVELDDQAVRALQDQTGQVVLLRRREDARSALAPSVAPGAPHLGVMLPYTPLHQLLMAPGGHGALEVLVMTSGNVSGEPIVTDDDEAVTVLRDLVDGWLSHDRVISVPCDDSVVRVDAGAVLPIRRSRGYAPLPIPLPTVDRPLLALGGDLKTCVCLAAHGRAWMSAHIGDMEHASSHAALARAVEHLERLLNVHAETVVVDQHPGYRTVHWAEQFADGRPIHRVQHHQAHLASLLVEAAHPPGEPVLGFVFDGAGYGEDGSIWGGEVFTAADWQFDRVGCLAPVLQLGGDASVRRPYRMALSHLAAAGVEWTENLPPVAFCAAEERKVLRRMLATGLASTPTSSMGRLFDAVSSLCGICHVAEYEAEAAMRFEGVGAHKDGAIGDLYRFELERGGLLLGRAEPVIKAVAADVSRGVSPREISSRFHSGVADLIVEMAVHLTKGTGIRTVGLTGGVFLNVLLSDLAQRALTHQGFSVLRHRMVPPSDGGLALGQAAISARR
jgi:hydrogenase maturation protein HypF